MNEDMELREAIAVMLRRIEVISNSITYSTAEAAAYLGCNVTTLRAMVHRGELPALRAGADWRYRKCDLDANVVLTRAAKAASISAGLAARRRIKQHAV